MASDDIESRPSQDVDNDTPKLSSMPQLARVVGHYDPTFMGKLQVEILRPVGNDLTDGQVMTVSMISPFYTVTSPEYIGDDPNDFNNTQKSAGMWFVPPDVGTTVLVIFVNGDAKNGYWYGCVPDENMNFMLPGIAATKYVVADTQETTEERVPVAEYNKKSPDELKDDATKNFKPEHPFATVLDLQGLLNDDTRGITTSSARREAPSSVFGISTPGPIDKQEGAKRGPRGTSDSLIPNAFVSRLGGSTFVMDDGDDKFLRKKPAGGDEAGPPEYASVEQDETDGDPTIPHNELIRIRTRTGHQILLHNSEDLIYITNSRGTAWIELTSNGKIDIYAADSISVHSENDINLTAKRDINLTAGANVNINATTNINQQAGAVANIKSGSNTNINPGGNFNVLAANTSIDGGDINLNSGVAEGAGSAPKTGRVPQTEPWAHHEHLDPLAYVPDKTKAGSPEPAEPEYFKKYTTTTDTFAKELPPSGEEEQAEEESEE